MSDDVMFKDSLYILNGLIRKFPENFVIVTNGIGFRDDVEIKYYLEIENRIIPDVDQYLRPMEKSSMKGNVSTRHGQCLIRIPF